MIVAQRPGRRTGKDRLKQLAPDREKLHAGARRHGDPRDRRRVPVDDEFDLDQHRLGVVSRQPIDVVARRQSCRADRGHANRRGARRLRRSGRHSELHPRPRSSRRGLRSAPALPRRCRRSVRGPNSPGRAGPSSSQCRRGCRAKVSRSPHTACRSAGSDHRAVAEKSSEWRSPRRASSVVRTRGSRRRPAGTRVSRRSSLLV